MKTNVPPFVRAFLFGTERNRYRYTVRLLLTVGVFGVAVGIYALELARESGGVVFVPEYAAGLGILVAGWAGYRRDGVVVGWLLAYASLLGYHAFRSFVDGSDTLPEKFAYFVRPDGLAYLAVAGVLIGLPAFLVGYGLRLATRRSGLIEE